MKIYIYTTDSVVFLQHKNFAQIYVNREQHITTDFSEFKFIA